MMADAEETPTNRGRDKKIRLNWSGPRMGSCSASAEGAVDFCHSLGPNTTGTIRSETPKHVLERGHSITLVTRSS